MRAPLGAHHSAIAAFRGCAHKREFALSYFWVHALDIGPQYRYITLVSFPEGPFARVLSKVERERSLRAGLRPAPGRLRASVTPVLRPVREVQSLDWDR